MEETLLDKIVNGLAAVHEAYEKAYTDAGITTENGKAMMEHIFQETWKSLKNQYIMNKVMQSTLQDRNL